MKLKWLSLLAMLFCTPALSYPSPLTCTRNFYVEPGGSDVNGCGTGHGTAACATLQGADANITGLKGGDCVNFAAGTYNMPGGGTLTKSGTANQANGYIRYIGTANHASKIVISSPGFFGLNVTNNYVSIEGFEWDGVNHAGYHGYSPSNTNTYNAQYGLLINNVFGPTSSHHHWFLNNVVH